MSVLFVVLPLALLVSSLAVVAFMVAVKRGEFDDLQTPARRILVDDEPVQKRPVTPPERPDSR